MIVAIGRHAGLRLSARQHLCVLEENSLLQLSARQYSRVLAGNSLLARLLLYGREVMPLCKKIAN